MITGHPQGVIFLRRMISYGSLLTSTSAKVTGERSLGSLKIGQVSGHEFNKCSTTAGQNLMRFKI